ncbi:class A beta-lactamase (plasmid) [Aquicoccus sp. G2-2]|uniref:class A beta-lactamase n=1 Tax=Aquicoccus sp. G2-2 TaxID=3092120 RepID=UPI002ADF22F0|nr:class A beta-lactamase [Aquicoccus sp. G2-2]MEA1111939.1 class A beta-lactamase [Aquicoccus sp. G2-2]
MIFPRLAAFVTALLMPFCVHAADLAQTIDQLESQLDARIGVAIYDSATGDEWTHRPNERFLMNSTVKALVCAAVLSRADLELTETLPVRAQDVVGHAPVTQHRIGGTMTIAGLCRAAVDQSDNGATNILFDRLGGPEQLTAFLRSIGDEVTRSDRTEPALNTFVPGDPRDTTSPAAMVRTLQTLLAGDALSPENRKLLADWMRPGGWTSALIRPAVPTGWDVSDKSGSGKHNRNLIAMLTPPNGAPIFVSLSISDTNANFATRNAALVELGAAVMAMLIKR